MSGDCAKNFRWCKIYQIWGFGKKRKKEWGEGNNLESVIIMKTFPDDSKIPGGEISGDYEKFDRFVEFLEIWKWTWKKMWTKRKKVEGKIKKTRTNKQKNTICGNNKWKGK